MATDVFAVYVQHEGESNIRRYSFQTPRARAYFLRVTARRVSRRPITRIVALVQER